MFTYLVFNPGTNFAGLSLAGRIWSKTNGVNNISDPSTSTDNLSAAELNALATQCPDAYSVAFSEQDIPKSDFLFWTWDTVQFNEITGAQRTNIENFLTNAKAMWVARRAKLKDLKVEFVTSGTANTVQHRKAIIGLEIKDFTENDWDALGLDTMSYVGQDLDYSYTVWKRLWDYIK